MIAFSIPGLPVAFARAGKSGKRHFTPTKQANFMAVVQMHAMQAMGSEEPYEGPVKLEARFIYPVPASWSLKRKAQATWKISKPDADNLIKIVKDACNAIVWKDDAQVAEMTVQKMYGPCAGAVVVVSSLNEDAA